MGSTFSITAPVDIKTNIGEVDVKSDIKSNIDPHIKMQQIENNNEIGILIPSQSSLLIITKEADIPLPDASKLPAYNYKIVNKTSSERLIKTCNGNTINNTYHTFKLLPNHYLSITSDGISSWWNMWD